MMFEKREKMKLKYFLSKYELDLMRSDTGMKYFFPKIQINTYLKK